MNSDPKSTTLYPHLDTTFVNLWSLLRKLTEREFIGRVHIELPDYSADVFMNRSSAPLVHEIDRAAGTESIEEGALHRVVLRARGTAGTITVFEGKHEAQPPKTPRDETTPAAYADDNEVIAIVEAETTDFAEEQQPSQIRPAPTADSFEIPEAREILTDDLYPTGSYQDWPAILKASGELIAAVESAVNAAGENFGNLFNRVRLQLADDYSFLDPMSQAFDYANGAVSLNATLPVSVYVSGLSEALRRSVDQVAVGDRARRVRERVALEMLAAARRHGEVFERSGFQAQLDRIAGTRVM